MKGILKITDDGWIVKDNNEELPIHPDDIELISFDIDRNNEEVEYELSKKFFAKEVKYYAKINKIKPKYTWEDILERYIAIPTPRSLTFFQWLKNNYELPKQK